MDHNDAAIHVPRKFDVTELAGEKGMVDFESGKYLMPKGVGNDILGMIEDNKRVSDSINILMKRHDVGEAECAESTMAFLKQVSTYEFISLEEAC